MSRRVGTRTGRHRSRASFVFLRQTPGPSPVHNLWAGTKLLAVAALSLTLSFAPSWSSVALMVVFVGAVGVTARVPIGAIPRLPRAFWAFLALGALLTLVAGGPPEVAVVGLRVGLGALDAYVRFTAVTLLLVVASAMVGWTTPLGEVAPALARLGRPLRRLRVPVDEWALAVSLCIRSLPLLIDEMRTLIAARRLRPRPRPEGHGWAIQLLDETADLLTAGLAVAIRRAGELAEAITARGGVPPVVPGTSRARRPDVVALAVTGLTCAAMATLYATL